MRKFYALTLLLWLFSFVFSTCKKTVKGNDFVTEKDINKVFDLPGEFPFSYTKKPTGGYFLVYGEFVNQQKDISVCVTDDKGNIIHKTTFGGSRNDAVWFSQIDADGSLYLCGLTRSPELRMDKNANLTNSPDGYIAKLDKDGNLLWQRGYCDTTSLSKGINEDYFYELYLINNKIYCIGMTSSWHTPIGAGQIDYDSWMVIFDKNGNVLKDRLLPTLYKGSSLSNFSGSANFDGIKLNNDDLILRYDFLAYQSEGRNMDTTAMLCRYNIARDSVMWTKYYRSTSPQGDICWGGLLGNGNVAFFDSYWNTINVMDVNNGNTISTTSVNNNTPNPNSDQYYTLIGISPFNINDNLYFLGNQSKGGTTNNQKPFVAKLNREGGLDFNKTFDIPNASFYWVSENENRNLQFMGSINTFNTDNLNLFAISTDQNGNIIK